MPLDPQVENFLQMVKLRELPPLETLTPAEARKSFEQSAQAMCRRYETVKTEDRVIQGFQDELNIRIYYPNEKPIGAIVYFHGGGWMIGNIETHDPLCHTLSALSGSIVVSVDYGLAPENKFPGPVEDAYMAARWVWHQADSLGFPKQALGVAGDSAGGNLAAAVSYLAFKRREFDLCSQLLLYPSTGFDYTESYEKYGKGYNLDASTMAWFRDHYLSTPEDKDNPLAAPMRIPEEEVKELPAAYIMTAEFDPLCDGGKAYAEKLQRAGVKVEYQCVQGMIHGFLGMTQFFEAGRLEAERIASAIKRLLSEHAGTSI